MIAANYRVEKAAALVNEVVEKFRRNHPRPTSLSGARFGNQGASEAGCGGARFNSKSAGASASPLDSLSYKGVSAEVVRKRAIFNAQWRACVTNANAALTADALTETVEPVFQALLELGEWSVDLSGLQPDQVNGVHLAVILRATLRHKKTTHGWDEALQVARAAVARMNLDERKVLSGLIKK